jgi:endoglucanase
MQRRNFIKASAAATVGAALVGLPAFAEVTAIKNKLPRWKGFNLLDFYSPNPERNNNPTPEDYFKWMQDWGFDFIRIPIAYPCYLDFDRPKSITPEGVYKIDNKGVDKIDALVTLAHKYNMHVSLNLHRAPGYCINAGFNEPYNLWTDQAALDAFCFHWGMWAKRYRHVSEKKLSFDLVNEPSMRADMNDQHAQSGPVPGDAYRKVAKAAVEAIHKENKHRLIIADGNWGGSNVIPELTDLPVAQSCRAYNPMGVTHYRAPWASKDPEHMPLPKWPGQVGDRYVSREMLEKFYQPWINLVKQGVGVHCGEGGCYNKTPHDVFMAWFADVLDILTTNQIGFAIWNFAGDFGVLNSNRADVAYEDWYGHKLDRQFLELLRKQ